MADWHPAEFCPRRFTDGDLRSFSSDRLWEMAGECSVDPGDPDVCDACAAYRVASVRTEAVRTAVVSKPWIRYGRKRESPPWYDGGSWPEGVDPESHVSTEPEVAMAVSNALSAEDQRPVNTVAPFPLPCLDAMQAMVHETAVAKGWWETPEPIAVKIALMHSELSEALEHIRAGHDPDEIWFEDDGKPDGVAVEFADVVIRIMDTLAFYGVSLSEALVMKAEYNHGRPYRHGGKAF